MNLGHAKIICIFPRSGASIILKYRIKGLEKIFRELPVQLWYHASTCLTVINSKLLDCGPIIWLKYTLKSL